VNSPAPTITGAITGGTGAYANKTGEFITKHTKYGALDTLKFGG
jgi:hypothetical protein